jgi:tetratricopeptide (TPR) repeat protein
MEKFGENEVLYTKLAYVYHVNGDYKQAETLYQKAMKINSTYSDPHNNMAYIELMHKNNKLEAMRYAKNAVEYSPGNPNFLDTLGIVYMAMNEYQKAQEVFQQAVAISPNNAEFQQNLEKAERAQ